MPSPESNSEHLSRATAFIPSVLDDAGLTPTEFRVYCAILRRGDCFESVPKIAERCRMHRDTAWAALKSLEARGAITKTSRLGHTTIFTALPFNLWRSGNGGPAENKGYPSKPGDTQPLNSATTQPEIRGSHPAESEGYKGNPIEGNPIKRGNPRLFVSELKVQLELVKEQINLLRRDGGFEDATGWRPNNDGVRQRLRVLKAREREIKEQIMSIK